MKKLIYHFIIIYITIATLFSLTKLSLLGEAHPLIMKLSLSSMPIEIEKKLNISFSFPSLLYIASASAYEEAPIIKKETPQKANTTKEEEPLPDGILETSILKGGTSLFGVEINNETRYDLTNCYENEPIPKGTGPEVLIIHTHTSESYRPSSAYPYEPTDNDRSQSLDYNVARVGLELKNELKRYGISAIHDTTINDYPSYNGSYTKAMTLIETYLKKYPSISIVIDLHRDAMIKKDGTKLSTVAEIDGKKAAQVMLVVGTDQNGLSHPNWRRNFSFAVNFQKTMNDLYPGLARPINLRAERFNGHLSNREVILEVGTTGNTLDEALLSAQSVAHCLAIMLDN